MHCQRDGFVAERWVKNEQNRHPMFIAVVAITDACVTFDNESVVGEGAEIIKTMEIGSYLRAYASGKVSIAGLKYGPLGGTRNGVDYLQTETTHR
jgi:hypothetical protein